MKPISRSQWNDGFGADSGPSQGDSRRRAIRPKVTFLIRPGTEGMALEADVPWRLSERVGSTETTLDLFARKNPDPAAGHVALTGQLSNHAM